MRIKKMKIGKTKPPGSVKKFMKEREKLNATVMKYASMNMKKFYNLDMHAYMDGALPRKTKEMLGLVASLVLRCDDCILYHLIRCFEFGANDAEIEEVLNTGLLIGGSIIVPHLRRALNAWDEFKKNK